MNCIYLRVITLKFYLLDFQPIDEERMIDLEPNEIMNPNSDQQIPSEQLMDNCVTDMSSSRT